MEDLRQKIFEQVVEDLYKPGLPWLPQISGAISHPSGDYYIDGYWNIFLGWLYSITINGKELNFTRKQSKAIHKGAKALRNKKETESLAMMLDSVKQATNSYIKDQI